MQLFETSFGPIRHIVRCRLNAGHAFASLIIKDVRRRDGANFDSNTVERFSSSYRFFSDCACTRFLSSELGVESCPELIAVDQEAGFAVLEDLGDDMSLVTALSGDSPVDAACELRRFAEALAQIQGRSAGHEADFKALRHGFGPGYDRVSTQDRLYIEGALPAIWSACHALGLEVRRAQEETALVLAALSQPGAYLALIHRDVIPPNFLSVGERLCIFDFEFSGYGHALVDIAQLRMGFPTYGQPAMIPHALVEEIEAIYLKRFADIRRTKIKYSSFKQALTIAACFWGLYELIRSLDAALDETHSQHKRRSTWLPLFPAFSTAGP